MKFVVVGAGFWGSVMAERIASVLGMPVTVLERRPWPGGNCRSSVDPETGIECHRHGSHIFHTSIPEVRDYLSRFWELTGYRHRVFISRKGEVYPMPVNLATVNAFYGTRMRPAEAEAFLKAEIARDAAANPANLEEKAVSLIGRPLYEAFVRDYTHKQWGRDPKDLPAAIISRLPFRTSYEAGYFDDLWQGVPKDGYFDVFRRILDHPLIDLRLGADFETERDKLPRDCKVIYTGMPDRLFGCEHGELEWRSLRFEWETLDVRDFQGTSVMNYADIEVPWTRIHEFKHYHPERTAPFSLGRTVICREFPETYRSGGEAYYPVNDARNEELHARYALEAERAGILLGGRLGSYRYWDMDKAVADALRVFETRIRPLAA